MHNVISKGFEYLSYDEEEWRVGHKAYNLSLLKDVKGKIQIQGHLLVLEVKLKS